MKIERHKLIFYRIPWAIFNILGILIGLLLIFKGNSEVVYLPAFFASLVLIFATLAGLTKKVECPECGRECICQLTWAAGIIKYQCKHCSFSEKFHVIFNK